MPTFAGDDLYVTTLVRPQWREHAIADGALLRIEGLPRSVPASTWRL